MKTTYFIVKGVFLLTKLQAEFTNYMKIALKHDSIDYFRSNKEKRNSNIISLSKVKEDKVLVPQISGIGTFFFSKISMSCISNEKLYFAIDSLTNNQKKILFMYADGISINEITEELDIKNGTVKATIFQIKKKIKKYIEEN